MKYAGVFLVLLAVAGIVAGIAVAFGACDPDFQPEGELTVDGELFAPTRCRVLTDSTGVELRDATSNRLRLTLPSGRIEAFTEISGPARATLTRPGSAPVELGECGTLRLRGQGYHSQGKRAASGTATLECAGGETGGELSFSGCF
jgi:hypothetical protein